MGPNGIVIPLSPYSASATQKTWHTFLESLSTNRNYKNLMLLLHIEESHPLWLSCESKDTLSKMFYNPALMSSYSAFKHWIKNDPIAADSDSLASYDQVEVIILGFGLTSRVIWIVQFPQQYLDVPTYIINSCYPFSEDRKSVV